MDMERDPESAHDVKSRGPQEQQKPNRKMRRREQKYLAKEAVIKANLAKKTKSPTKSEVISIIRERQGLPPLEPKKKEVAIVQEQAPVIINQEEPTTLAKKQEEQSGDEQK